MLNIFISLPDCSTILNRNGEAVSEDDMYELDIHVNMILSDIRSCIQDLLYIDTHWQFVQVNNDIVVSNSELNFHTSYAFYEYLKRYAIPAKYFRVIESIPDNAETWEVY